MLLYETTHDEKLFSTFILTVAFFFLSLFYCSAFVFVPNTTKSSHKIYYFVESQKTERNKLQSIY